MGVGETMDDDAGTIARIDDLTTLSKADLKRELGDVGRQLAEVNATRRGLAEHQAAVQAELGRRRTAEEIGTYDERRRAAVLAGAAVPKPPVGVAVPVQGRAAAARLAGLAIVVARPSTSDPVPAVKSPAPGEDEASSIDAAVTDHALVRYMERVMGFDFGDVRDRIMSPTVRAALAAGVTRIRIAGGYVVAKDGVVTTFLPPDAAPGRRGRPKTKRAGRNSDPTEADDAETSTNGPVDDRPVDGDPERS